MNRAAAYVLLFLLTALLLAKLAAELLVLPAALVSYGTEIFVLVALSLLVGVPFAIAKRCLDRRLERKLAHRATSKS